MHVKYLVLVLFLNSIWGPNVSAFEQLIPVKSGLNVQTEKKYYILTSHELDALRQELYDKQSENVTDKHYAGQTLSDFEIIYQRILVKDQCVLQSYTIELKLTITLPLWQPDKTPSKKFESKWRKVEQAITDHEQEHQNHAIDAANDIDHELKQISPQRSCGMLAFEVERIRSKHLNRMQFRDNTFDRNTRHGLNTGTRMIW